MSPTPVELFLLDVDAHWPLTAPRIPLKVFGSTALMLQTTYVRGTKDSDILGVDPILGTMAEDLLRLAGKDSTLHRKHQIYLDVVSAGVPFFPHPTHWLPATDLNARLRSFEVQLLDITDVVLTAPPPKGRGFPVLLSDMGHLLLQIGFARLWDLTIPALSVRFGA